MFKLVTLEDKPIFDKHFAKCRYENSWYTFANIYIWRQRYKTEWMLDENDTLYLRANDLGARYFLSPFTDNEQHFLYAINKMSDICISEGIKLVVTGLSKEMLIIIENNYTGRFSIKAMPDMFDYVYNTDDLLNLEGRKYHSKRNHIKKFKRLYSQYEYLPLDNSTIEDCKRMADEWCKERDCSATPDLADEQGAVIEALKYFQPLGLDGAVITLGGKVQAFTLGEMLNKDTAVIHIEKGNTSFDGIYPLINNEFCKSHWSHTKYINREEDMGEDGLRKAKESYYPVKMIEKYIAKEI